MLVFVGLVARRRVQRRPKSLYQYQEEDTWLNQTNWGPRGPRYLVFFFKIQVVLD